MIEERVRNEWFYIEKEMNKKKIQAIKHSGNIENI